jgi:hypothetical protein
MIFSHYKENDYRFREYDTVFEKFSNWKHRKPQQTSMSWNLFTNGMIVALYYCMKAKQQMTDFERGRKEAKAGYYDKWYRYNRKDDGAEYDRGHAVGMTESKREGGCIIIPCVA